MVVIIIFSLYKTYINPQAGEHKGDFRRWIQLMWNNKNGDENKYEGFSQDRPFVLKQDNDIYDDFYIEIYNDLTNIVQRSQDDVAKIVETTGLNVAKSNILDVGCGTGLVVKEFAEKGAIVKGVDKSPAMIKHATNTHLLQCFTNGEAEDPTLYERGAFTHILCLYMTIYEMQNKTTFFRNAFYGLQPGGYLVVHLCNNVKEGEYRGFIHLGKPKALDEKTIADAGIKSHEVDFGGFTYKRDWSDSYMLKETFTDRDTHTIRQNELHWHYEPISVIVEQCKSCGFRVYTHIPASPSIGGWLYFFMKPGGTRK